MNQHRICRRFFLSNYQAVYSIAFLRFSPFSVYKLDYYYFMLRKQSGIVLKSITFDYQQEVFAVLYCVPINIHQILLTLYFLGKRKAMFLHECVYLACISIITPGFNLFSLLLLNCMNIVKRNNVPLMKGVLFVYYFQL